MAIQRPAILNSATRIFAEDTLQVLDKLGIQRTDIVGWSDGGIIALLLGLEAPQRVGRIVAISANFQPSGLIPEANRVQNQSLNIPPNKITDWLRSWWSGAGERHACSGSGDKGIVAYSTST